MNQQSFISDFLLAPRFRAWRYLVLTLFFTVVSVNMAIVGYMDIIRLMGNNVYWITIGTVFIYVVTVYLFLRFAIGYLWSGRCVRFAACVLLCALLYTAVPNSVYVYYIDGYDLWSEAIIIDNLSTLALYMLCILGVIIPVFIRSWILSSQHLTQLKLKQEASQVEQFKEQINPASFFKILNRSKDLVKPEPEKASAMLMKLGQLLRYQLYDCNRRQVLLTAEIAFLRNFLDLEKLYTSKLNYTITTEGNILGVFILPSVFLPFVQSMMNTFDDRQELWTIDISASSNNGSVSLALDLKGVDNETEPPKDMRKVRERLDTLYKNRYRLSVTKGMQDTKIVTLQLEEG